MSEALRGLGRVGRVWGCQTAVSEGHKNRSAAKAVSWRDQPSEGVSEALRGFGSVWRYQARVSERDVQSQALPEAGRKALVAREACRQAPHQR